MTLIWDLDAKPTQAWVDAWNADAKAKHIPYRLRLNGLKVILIKLVEEGKHGSQD